MARLALMVTGTDTEVGKTWLTGALAAALRQRGFGCGVWKPVQSGAPLGDPSSDAARLKAWSGVNDDVASIATYTFAAPLAPLLAAEAEGAIIRLGTLDDALRSMAAKYEALLVEGAGGLAVPVTDEAMIIDLAVRWRLPLLIVAKAGLGTVNQTLQTIAYARQYGVRPIGVIFNGFPSSFIRERGGEQGWARGREQGGDRGLTHDLDRGWEQGGDRGLTHDLDRGLDHGLDRGGDGVAGAAGDVSMRSNAALFRRFSDVPVLGEVPRMPGPDVPEPDEAMRRRRVEWIETYVRVDALIEQWRGAMHDGD